MVRGSWNAPENGDATAPDEGPPDPAVEIGDRPGERLWNAARDNGDAMAPATRPASPGNGDAGASGERLANAARSPGPNGTPQPRVGALPDFGPRLVRASSLIRHAAVAPAEPWPPPGHVCELTGDVAAAATSLAVAAAADVQRTGGIAAWVQPHGGALFPPDLAANDVDLDALVVVHVPSVAATRAPVRTAGNEAIAVNEPAGTAADEPAGTAADDAGAELAARTRGCMRSTSAEGAARRAAPAPRAGARGGGSAVHELPKAAELLLRSGAFDLLVLDLRPNPPKAGAWLGRLQALAREHGTRVLLLTDAHAPIVFATGLAQRLEPLRRRAGDTFVIETRLRRDKLHAGALPPLLPRRGPLGLS